MKEPLGIAHKLWAQINVFYKHLHAYIRRILQNKYGTNFVDINGSIPIHFFKSLSADQWNNLINISLPYPENQKNKIPNYKSGKILSEAQRVYVELGFEELPKRFWKDSIFRKNYSSSTIMDCHPLSFDFMNGIDFRVKMCLSDSSNDFDSELRKVVHEFGHIYYFKSYANKKNLFKSGPNSAFHEAIGDLMVLINNACEWKYNEVDYRVIINALMKEALNNFVIIPWALSLEQWRHDLFSGKVSILSANEHFWNIRRKVEGIVPPNGKRLKRSFDAICKYHVANFMPYLRYFFSRFLSHQFHKALCAHNSDPLYLCCPKPLKSSFR
jgi:peptidyl-dipeptidase A